MKSGTVQNVLEKNEREKNETLTIISACYYYSLLIFVVLAYYNVVSDDVRVALVSYNTFFLDYQNVLQVALSIGDFRFQTHAGV